MSPQWNQRFAARTAQMKRSAVRELLKLTAQPGMISFAGGLPAPELFPLPEISLAVRSAQEKAGTRTLQYGETEGIAELRDWIAARFSRPGFQVERKNVLIVSGGQQGLDLIGRILLDPGDKVLVENPTYLALLSAWRPLGVEFLPVPSDNDGLRVDSLEGLLKEKPKLLYTVPTFQNPQGTTLTLERRHRLIHLLKELDLAVVEDNPYGELRYSGQDLPSLFDLHAHQVSGEGHLSSDVMYVGTFSKILTPGLRVGWVLADEQVIDKLVQAKQAVDLHTSTLSQWITYELVQSGLLERQIPLLRRAYCERRDAMLAALDRYFSEEVQWTRPDGGMFLMVTLPGGMDASELLKRSIEKKVAFVPGDDFHLNGMGTNRLRLNFSNAKPEMIDEGIKRLGEALATLNLTKVYARSEP